MNSYSPWAHVGRMPDVIVAFSDEMPSGRGWWSPGHRVVLLAKGLTQRARRSVLAHELAHCDLGHSGLEEYPDAERQDARIHGEADQLAARRLIPLERLADALKWSGELEEVADELWVELDLVRTRLDHLHPAERHRLRALLQDCPES